MAITSFKDLKQMVTAHPMRRRIAVISPTDYCTIEAVSIALNANIADFILVGDTNLKSHVPTDMMASPHVRIVEVPDADIDKLCFTAVDLTRNNEADILMKGLVNTDNYLRAVLNKEHGLLPKGNVLTHLTAAEIPSYHKVLFFSDVAVIPYPTLEQRVKILKYDLATCRKLGIDTPKVALIHFTEKVNTKFQNSVDYVALEEMADKGAFGSVMIGGPMDVKTACDRHSAQIKGIASPVCGDADLLMFPNIESGNTFYKAINLFGGAIMAGILQGTQCPVILPSRSDSAESKFYSMLLACVNA
jgi:phosphate butyryltransferase